jgi:hypothetical protein
MDLIQKLLFKNTCISEKYKYDVIMQLIEDFKYFSSTQLFALINNILQTFNRSSVYYINEACENMIDFELLIRILSKIIETKNIDTTLYLHVLSKKVYELNGGKETFDKYLKIVKLIFDNADKTLDDYVKAELKDFIKGQIIAFSKKYIQGARDNYESYIESLKILACDKKIDIFEELSWFRKNFYVLICPVEFKSLNTPTLECFYVLAKHKIIISGLNNERIYRLFFNMLNDSHSSYSFEFFISALNEFHRLGETYMCNLENFSDDKILFTKILSSSSWYQYITPAIRQSEGFRYIIYLTRMHLAMNIDFPKDTNVYKLLCAELVDIPFAHLSNTSKANNPNKSNSFSDNLFLVSMGVGAGIVIGSSFTLLMIIW